MNVDALKSFLAISKYKSMTKAAETLHITQPTLSARIKNLENHLNLKLLKRTWQGVELTNYGMVFLPHAIQMLSRLNDFTSISNNFKDFNNKTFLNSTELMNNTYRIGINNYLVSEYSEKIISKLVQQYPGLHFEFFLGSTKNLMELIDYNAVDIIIYYSNHEINQLNTDLIGYDEMVFAFCDEDYELVYNDFTKIKDINKPLYLNSNPALSVYLDHFHHLVHLLELKDLQMIENLTLIKNLVKSNQGYAAIPLSIFNHYFSSDNINLYKLSNHLPILRLYVTHDKDSKFIEHSQFLSQSLADQTI